MMSSPLGFSGSNLNNMNSLGLPGQTGQGNQGASPTTNTSLGIVITPGLLTTSASGGAGLGGSAQASALGSGAPQLDPSSLPKIDNRGPVVFPSSDPRSSIGQSDPSSGGLTGLGQSGSGTSGLQGVGAPQIDPGILPPGTAQGDPCAGALQGSGTSGQGSNDQLAGLMAKTLGHITSSLLEFFQQAQQLVGNQTQQGGASQNGQTDPTGNSPTSTQAGSSNPQADPTTQGGASVSQGDPSAAQGTAPPHCPGQNPNQY